VDKKADAIVVTYHSAEVIGDCIASLKKDPAVGRIFVVNNSAGDDTNDVVRNIQNVIYIEPSTNIGFGPAINLARHHSSADYVVLANPDTTQSGQTVSQAINFMLERSHAALVGPRMISPDGKLYRNSQHSLRIGRMVGEKIGLSEKFGVPRSSSEHQRAHRTDYVIGSFMICRRSALDTIEWFDDRIFLFGEDQDICRRLRAAGWEVWYAPLGEVVHHSGHSWRQLDDEGREWFRRARRRELKEEEGYFAVAMYSVLEKLSRLRRQ
jgi:GT2 family glycosyltransferase